MSDGPPRARHVTSTYLACPMCHRLGPVHVWAGWGWCAACAYWWRAPIDDPSRLVGWTPSRPRD